MNGFMEIGFMVFFILGIAYLIFVGKKDIEYPTDPHSYFMPNNKEQFFEYYRRLQWDKESLDFNKLVKGLNEYVYYKTRNSYDYIDTKEYFGDLESVYVNMVTVKYIDSMDNIGNGDVYQRIEYKTEINLNGEENIEFFRKKTPLYNIKFSQKYYEELQMERYPMNSYFNNYNSQFFVDSPGSIGNQNGILENVSTNFNNYNAENIIDYIKYNGESISDKRERRVLEDIVEILEEGSYPSEKEVDEITSEVKKRPFALKILQDAGIKFSEEVLKITGSEAVKWFIDWINNL